MIQEASAPANDNKADNLWLMVTKPTQTRPLKIQQSSHKNILYFNGTNNNNKGIGNGELIIF